MNHETIKSVPTKFVVLATQRCGSTWMIDMLNSHPAVVAFSELFISGGQGSPKWGGSTNITLWESYRALREDDAHSRTIDTYLDQVFASSPHVRAAGFKLMYEQERGYPQIIRYLTDHQGSLIHLVRDNVLDILVSKETALLRDRYHARQSERVSPVRIEIDTKTVVQRLRDEQARADKAKEYYRDLGLPYLEVRYEELCECHEHFVPVLRFLGVDPTEPRLSSSLQKLNQNSHAELIENYHEVSNVIRGTPFEHFLR